MVQMLIWSVRLSFMKGLDIKTGLKLSVSNRIKCQIKQMIICLGAPILISQGPDVTKYQPDKWWQIAN